MVVGTIDAGPRGQRAEETMTRYEIAADAITSRGITLATEPVTIQMTASQVRQSGPGRPYIDRLIAGISRSATIHPRVSDAAQTAEMTISGPQTEAERAQMTEAIAAWLRATPPSGSQYDPARAGAWTQHRAVLASLA